MGVIGFFVKSLLTISIVLVSILAYFVIQELKTPDLGHVDLDVWWGPNGTKYATSDTSIRPFRVVFTDAMLERLTRKFNLYKGQQKKTNSLENTAWTYGINSDALEQVFSHWQFKYDVNKRQRFLNKYNHFKTNIQGLDIHFVHVKPKVEQDVKVFPLLLLHGWPSTFRDFYSVIPLLTTVRPGYDFVFEVIVPSLPGFAYSQASSKPGLNSFQTAIIMRNLMQRLGIKQYYVQGGDFGHMIGSHMATIFPDEVLGFHTNLPANFSKLAQWTWIFGAIWPSLVTDSVDKMYPLKDKAEFFLEEFGYMHLQGTKPDTIGIALNDSPLGLAAYILDRFLIFTDINNKNLQEKKLAEKYPITDILDNIMIYWMSGCITSSIRFYKESFLDIDNEQKLAKIPTPVPTWGLRLKNELIHHPDFILKWKYPNLVGTTDLNFGGHFAAFERPNELATDLFVSVDSFNKLK